MRSPVETRCAGVADMCMRRLYQKESSVRGAELGGEGSELKAAARRGFYRRDAEYAEKGNGERFSTECTEERRRAQRKAREILHPLSRVQDDDGCCVERQRRREILRLAWGKRASLRMTMLVASSAVALDCF